MKANVQYNDFVGTAAADISDHTDLIEFLKSKGIDTEHYIPIGASFYHSYSDFFSASIICIDNSKTTESKPYIVKLSFEDEINKDEFFDLFKRFNVIINKKFDGHQEQDINEEIVIDNRQTS